MVRQFDIWVDGARLGTYGPDLATRNLAVGPHAFRFVGAGDCCVDAEWVETVTAGEGEQRVGRALRFRPAMLSVETNVPADVEVAGRVRGRSRSLIQVPLTQYTESLRVVARADGYRSAETTVELRPNQVGSVTLVLEPAPPAAPQGSDPQGPTPGERAKLDSSP
jgi:hypothetical protein